jgi:hypothetical protein
MTGLHGSTNREGQMKFELRQFSKRYVPVECAVFVIHEPVAVVLRATGAAILTTDGAVFIGVALCSRHDQFIKKVGRAKALGRAASELYTKPPNIRLSGVTTADNVVVDQTVIVKEVKAAIENRIKQAKNVAIFMNDEYRHVESR